jgi:hypothetical protein
MHVANEVRQRVLDEINAAPEHAAAIALALANHLAGKKDLPGHQSLPGALASLGLLDHRCAAPGSTQPVEAQAAAVSVLVEQLCSEVEAVQAAALDALKRQGLADVATVHLLGVVERQYQSERVAAHLLGLCRLDTPAASVRLCVLGSPTSPSSGFSSN